jgi:hypothetical protein
MGISGGIAGAVAGLSFAIVHGVMISEIWFSLPMLLVAGALCGCCLGATYGMLRETPSLASWLGYNALFVGFFALIAIVSELVYEPMISLAELMAGGPPSYMWGQAMPLVVVCTLLMATLLQRIYGRTWGHFLALLGTSAALVLLLGLNISLMGLVYVPIESYYLVAETFGLILILNLVFAACFAGLEWKRFLVRPNALSSISNPAASDLLKEDKIP